MFRGVYSLEFSKTLDIISMISKEKEKVQFQYEAVNEEIINPDDAHGCVEICGSYPDSYAKNHCSSV